MTKVIVITTINYPSKAIQLISEKCKQGKVTCCIIGDEKTPSDFSVDSVEYLNLDRQNSFFSKLAMVLPYNHYARKNIGYLWAYRNQFEVLHETDDDNIPLQNFWEIPKDEIWVRKLIHSTANQWCNIYNFYTDRKIWPRGLPLEKIDTLDHFRLDDKPKKMKWAIIQGLADKNPDVDAVYRLTYPLPIYFNTGLQIEVQPGLWSPFNSQNTIFKRVVFPLLYLPSYCSFRMTDIWRSLIAQRCLWELNTGIIYSSPTVYQERNEHNLIKDFEQEIPGYLNNSKIACILYDLNLTNDIAHNLLLCYEALIKEEIFPARELEILNLWLNEFN